MRHPSGNTGITLIELMIAVAIIGILTAIAIPAYRGYILTSQQGAAKANMEPLRIAIEDFFLDNGNYGAGGADKAAVQAAYNWAPDGDQNAWDYAVAVPGAAVGSNYDITVTHNTSGHGSTCPTNGACNDF